MDRTKMSQHHHADDAYRSDCRYHGDDDDGRDVDIDDDCGDGCCGAWKRKSPRPRSWQSVEPGMLDCL